ncbi:MAG: NAD(P)-dependent oxidoreductase [Gemmatimonadota bacterium]
MPNIAYLGTGLLGAAFVEAAIGRGDAVTVWNRTSSKAKFLESLGATCAATPADAVRAAERIHLVLRDDEAVDEVVAALRPGLQPGAVIIDHSTNAPDQTAQRVKRLHEEGVAYLHCPVFIGPAAARAGKGIILACGPNALFERVRSALERQADRVEYLGEDGGRAAVYKLAGNAYIVGIAALIADVFAVAGGGGIPPEEILELFGWFDAGRVVAGRGASMARGDFTPSFELTMARKDVGLMLDAAGDLPMAMLAGLAARMDQLIAEGHGGQDFGVLALDSLREKESRDR